MKTPSTWVLMAVGLSRLVHLCLAHDNSTGALVPSKTGSSVGKTSLFVDADVPTGTPIAGDYGGQYRPQIHYSPPRNFMNDPNGMFRDGDGTWHLYYQYNPTANVAGNQHWGHATSQDLYHWVNQPIALFPPEENVFIFSGSIVTDPNNTSGFFPDQLNGVVAIYTLAKYHTDGSPGPQTQAIAYSHDGGYSFIPYKRNPVISSSSSQFRDPKVVRYKDHWVMAVAYAQEFAIGIFTSPNLIDWTPASNFSSQGLLGLQWECPNLVRMPYTEEDGQRRDDMWLLVISINPGAPLGGSISQYYPGSFNGTHFEAVDSVTRIADFGKDNYAGQFFYGVPEDEDPVFIAWASNWQYTQNVPTDAEKWRSAMSLPRKTHLIKSERIGWKWVSQPYNLEPVLQDVLAHNESLGNGTIAVDFSHVPSNALYWEVNITGIPEIGVSPAATLNFTFSSPQTGEYLRGGFYLGGDAPFFLDRGGVRGFDNVFYTDKFSVNNVIAGNSWSMTGIIDRSLLEVFISGGVESATSTFFATQPLTFFVLSTSALPGELKVSVRVYSLQSAWEKMQSPVDGLVYGNQSFRQTGVEEMRHIFGALDSP